MGTKSYSKTSRESPNPNKQKGVSTFFSNVWNEISGNNQIDKQLNAQSDENQRMREYNLQLAKMQNQWNLEQWQRENAYNSPSAQKARLESAGLNADMMYGGSGVSNTAASSPVMTAGSAASPMDWTSLGSKRTIGTLLNQSVEYAFKKAQIDNIKADTKNKVVEGDILSSDLKFKEALNQSQIDLTNMQIRGISSDINVNEEQITKMRAEVKNLDASTTNLYKTYDKLAAEISNIDADTAYKKIRAVLDSKETDALVTKMAADTNLSKAECRAIVSKLPYELLNLKEQASYTTEQIKFVKLENDVLTWQFGQDKSYDDWKRSIGIAGDVVNALEGLASIIGTAFGSGKPTRIRGFK